jgi:hypothetical protein
MVIDRDAEAEAGRIVANDVDRPRWQVGCTPGSRRVR